MSELLTNYLDDILAETMNGKRKYRITHSNGLFEDVTIEDVSEYDQIGSNFGAGDINKTNQAVNEKFDSGDVVDPMLTTEPGFAADAYQTKLQFDEQNNNLTASDNLKFQFETDGEGNYGYLGADDSFIPFKKKETIYAVGGGGKNGGGTNSVTIPIAANGYKKLRIANILSYCDWGMDVTITANDGTILKLYNGYGGSSGPKYGVPIYDDGEFDVSAYESVKVELYGNTPNYWWGAAAVALS